ncbi:MAG: MotA/TolQ/ExbB proton channel family protein [Myxococcota bacterium]
MSFALLGAGWVLWLLVGLSVACVAISVERALYLLRDATDRALLRTAFVEFERGIGLGTLPAQIAPLTGFEARVLRAGLAVAPRGLEAAERAFVGTVAAEKLRMDRGLAVLATTGATAPFVGLFGTVLGIIQSFHDLSVNTSEASEAVMAGISEALVATAVGLMVAIPAVVLYNTFNRWTRARVSRVESLANLVLSRIDPPALSHGRAHG